LIQDRKIFTVGTRDFNLRHLLVIGILAASFSISAMVRSQAADYGFQLNEFDPFFNYRATEYLLHNGVNAYVHWHDTMSWYPQGRDVFATAQVPLHFTDAILYKIFGGGLSLYDFTIIFPVVFGSLTTVIVFALVRVMGGTTSGLFASLFFAISPPIIVRGTIGWFKSEPLGLFYGLLGVYLFLSGIKTKNRKVAIAKLFGGAGFLSIGFASWGGIEFFLIPLGIFVVVLPFVRKDHKFLLWAIPFFVAITMAVSGGVFARPGIGFVFGERGFALIGPTLLMVIIIFIQKFSKDQVKLRNSLLVLAACAVVGLAIIASGVLHSASFRYLNAVDPFLSSVDPLVESVAEHATPTLAQNFAYFSILMLFAGFAIWLIFRKKNDNNTSLPFNVKNEMTIFALILGIVGAYAGSTFSRLELLTASSVIVLASIGLAAMTSEILKKENKPVITGSSKEPSKKKTIQTKKSFSFLGTTSKISFVVVVVALLLVPTVFPVGANWISMVKAPPTILNGGSNFAIASTDWPDAMNWLKNNTPPNSVIASWWDYGYWIETLGDRTTFIDNATLSTNKIAGIAKMFLSSPDDAWKMLQDMHANYVIVYVVGQKFVSNGQELYILGGGGDESKKQWFIKIAGENETQFLQSDQFTPTDYFWQNTLLGHMFPFTTVTYYDPSSHSESQTYQPGFTAIYAKDIKYPENGNGPLKLVYQSSSLNRTDSGVISGVLIYQVNANYTKASYIQQQANSTQQQTSNAHQQALLPKILATNSSSTATGDTAVITTKYGDITLKLFNNVAPKTVANFEKLANSGFYNGTLFHRIVPGFVIQGGDPNTINGSRDTWGMGDAGYTIPPEFSDLNFTEYMVGMARGQDVNSGSSQFFITVGDASFLNGKYTLFGQVTSGQNVVDKIASLPTNSNAQPVNPDDARIITIRALTNSTK
jgi:dolichyl-diphosphooligosaccharide--protein glycosyltransferase